MALHTTVYSSTMPTDNSKDSVELCYSPPQKRKKSFPFASYIIIFPENISYVAVQISKSYFCPYLILATNNKVRIVSYLNREGKSL